MADITFSGWLAGLADATAGGSVYRNVVIQDGVPKKSPAVQAANVSALNVTASRYIATTDFEVGYLKATSAGTVTLTIPLQYSFGTTFNPDNAVAKRFAVQRFFGPLIIATVVYRGVAANQNAMIGYATAETGDWVQRLDAGNQVYVLTGADKTLPAHWTAVPFATANRPRIFWGAVASEVVMVALSNALPGDWVTRTDLSAAVYELQTAPFSTAGNWLVRTDEHKPTVPEIKIVFNNLNPANLEAHHWPVEFMQEGRDQWVAG